VTQALAAVIFFTCQLHPWFRISDFRVLSKRPWFSLLNTERLAKEQSLFLLT
jgi:hypothetical protein